MIARFMRPPTYPARDPDRAGGERLYDEHVDDL
jgi:hypothetical protein